MKHVVAVTLDERGELVTVVYAVCATGNTLPSILIFPRVHCRDHLIPVGPFGLQWHSKQVRM